MNELIEKEFEEIAKKSQPLFKKPVKSKDCRKTLLPLLDPNIDLITKLTILLAYHDEKSCYS